MNKHQILETYGKSIYQIRLDVALRLYSGPDTITPEECLRIADDFLKALSAEDIHKIKAMEYGQERL